MRLALSFVVLALACSRASSPPADEDDTTESDDDDNNDNDDGASGRGGGTPAPPDGGAPKPTSFDVTATFEWMTSDTALLPMTSSLVLHLNGDRVVLGAKGTAAEAEVEERAGTISARSPLRLPPAVGSGCPTDDANAPGTFVFETLTVERTADGLVGTATGEALFAERLEGPIPFSATLRGRPDTTRPSFALGNPATESPPTEPVVVVANEPVAIGAARLRAGDTTVELDPVRAGGHVVGFATPSIALAPATSYALELDTFSDLAANEGTTRPTTVKTAAIPLLTDLGFERGDVTTASPGVMLSSGELPAIAGARSLFVPPTNTSTSVLPRFLARVAVPSGAARLSARVRLAAINGYQNGVRTRHGLVVWRSGGAARRAALPNAPSTWVNAGATTGTLFAPNTETVSIALPEGVAAEILLEIEPQPEPCKLAVPPYAGLLLDDVRFD